jgi:hypothetical protein
MASQVPTRHKGMWTRIYERLRQQAVKAKMFANQDLLIWLKL